MGSHTPEGLAAWLADTARAFMASEANDLHMPGSREPAYAEPLVRFAAGDDPLWEEYKKHVGPFHWTPLDAFRLGWPDDKARAEELTVMSWILPQTEATRRDNRQQKDLPAERWARARIFGEEHVNNGLRKHMLAALDAAGYQAVSPMLLPEWSRLTSEVHGFASNWSERHAAYAAGHGTFGLCDGLITKAGKAMRAGSLILKAMVPASGRDYTDHREYCLFFSSGTCGVCIRRCPVGALSRDGHDKVKCKDFLRNVTAPHVQETWKFAGYGCGLCQVGVPCEKGIPPRPGQRRESAS